MGSPHDQPAIIIASSSRLVVAGGGSRQIGSRRDGVCARVDRTLRPPLGCEAVVVPEGYKPSWGAATTCPLSISSRDASACGHRLAVGDRGHDGQGCCEMADSLSSAWAASHYPAAATPDLQSRWQTSLHCACFRLDRSRVRFGCAFSTLPRGRAYKPLPRKAANMTSSMWQSRARWGVSQGPLDPIVVVQHRT